jgi:hypothetical protein
MHISIENYKTNYVCEINWDAVGCNLQSMDCHSAKYLSFLAGLSLVFLPYLINVSECVHLILRLYIMTLPAADMFHIHSKYSFLTEAWHSFSYTYKPNVYVSEMGIMHLRIKRARQEKVHLQ